MADAAEQQTDLPTPRYRMGQTVWHAGTEPAQEKHDCPDCLKQGTWAVKSPAGYESTVECPRCSGRGYLTLQSAGPSVRRLTIGMVRACSRPLHSGDDHVEYMCGETGIGSGSVYSESKLFDSEEAARSAAEAMAVSRRSELDARNQDRAKLRSLYVHSLKDAAIKQADDRAYEAERRLSRLLERICELDEYPIAGGRYVASRSYASLKPEQAKAVQESLVWLNEKDADFLDEWRAAESAA